ncbi:MAG TPA: lytic transglycosylase domain-containing protein [Pyrinomonadaceae bacterium]|nr:lytic transglycosylase domain-containing protein [Pyrinomonadaceae bacterium]
MCGQLKQITLVLVLCSLSALTAGAQQQQTPAPKEIGKIITFQDGRTFQVDDVFKQGDELWYRKGNVTAQLPHPVKSLTPIYEQAKPAPAEAAKTAKTVAPQPAAAVATAIWIHLVDGAKFRVDQVQEATDGAWYTRNNMSIFLAKDRISRIEHEVPGSATPSRRTMDWTSGNPAIDQLIRANGERFGIDPYLVFLVIEKESRFRTRAVSPKGAMGLMQLMPGTARRLGVRKPFDPAENIRGGTKYLRELMDMFDGKVNLVLASYNAGEGAVLKYGRNVPPYRETRDYVRTIGKRYGLSGRQPGAENDVPDPER